MASWKGGADEDFHRGEHQWKLASATAAWGDNSSLGTVEEPPFYGIELHPAGGSSVGLLTDIHGQVIHQRRRLALPASDHAGRKMPGSGTRTFLEPDRSEASLRQTLIDTLVTPCGRFKARLTWAELHHLQLLRCEEEVPRIAYLSLAPRLVYVAFPGHSGPLPVWRGTELQAGDIVFHSRGERLHQVTPGPSIWT
jgi:hypothetical protein